MKIKQLIQIADEFLSAESRKRKEKTKYLKQLLKKLRKREIKLEKKFKEGRGNKEKVSREIALIHAYRKKGLKQLKQLKNLKKEGKNCGKNKPL